MRRKNVMNVILAILVVAAFIWLTAPGKAGLITMALNANQEPISEESGPQVYTKEHATVRDVETIVHEGETLYCFCLDDAMATLFVSPVSNTLWQSTLLYPGNVVTLSYVKDETLLGQPIYYVTDIEFK